MMRGTRVILLGSLMIIGVCATSASAVQKKKAFDHHAYSGNEIVDYALAYSFAEPSVQAGTGAEANSPKGLSIGSVTSTGSSVSPGVTIGGTYWDLQQYGSMGRMIETGPHTGGLGYPIVHMSYTYAPEAGVTARGYWYFAYDASSHSWYWCLMMDLDTCHGAFVNVDVTPDNRAVVGGHSEWKIPYTIFWSSFSPELYYDGGPGYGTFPNRDRLSDTLKEFQQISAVDCCWPKFVYQYGTDTVMHVVARMSEPVTTDPGAIMYFRKVGFEGAPATVWEYPPYVVDTVHSLAHDVNGQRSGDRVALVWLASLPYTGVPYEMDCDTCSGVSYYDGYLIGQMDNDVYYQESDDQGATWNPRVNLTQCVIGAAAYKAYTDATVLYDSQDKLHIAWTACPWPADLCMDDTGRCWSDDWYIKNARLMHWSENVPYIRAVADQVYDVNPAQDWIDSCRAGHACLNIAKPSLSECDGKLYMLWTQFNNPRLGVVDDCAQWALDEPQGTARDGGANGELWVSVSGDWGLTWDHARNLTNSYSPACDPGFGDSCMSDHWPSMTRIGREVGTGEDWSGAFQVDPSGGEYTGDYYLDVMYVSDADAGAARTGEGSWTQNKMMWFRMACVEPVPGPVFTTNWTHLGEPTNVFPCEYFDTTIIIENIGNAALTYSMEVVYDSGATGWLGTSGFSGSVPCGLTNTEVGSLRLNQLQWNDTSNCYAHLHFTGNDPNYLPADVYIELIMIDTVIPDPIPFASAVDYATGDAPLGVFAADVDGDGDADLAVANVNSDNVSIFENNGDGTFAAAVNYLVGDMPYSVFAADLDGDSDRDLAVANFASGSVSILKNNGDGTFAAAVNYPANMLPANVFAADLDGDGDKDLAVPNWFTSTVSILKNNGDGTFTAAVTYPVGSMPQAVFAVDLDGDDDADLAVANNSSDNVSVLKNNGDGTFASAVDYAVGMAPYSVFAADLDDDGDKDLAVANYGSGTVSILMNNGDGTFAAAVDYAAGDSPQSVFAIDLACDGDIDLAVANSGSDSVAILQNNGDGAFFPPVCYATGDEPLSLFAADLDKDGDNDLAVTNSQSASVSILLNLTDPVQEGFAESVEYDAGVYPSSVYSADLDNDGDRDLAVVNSESDDVSVLTNDGDGTFGAAVNYAVNDYPASVHGADFDNDGDRDLAVANAGSDNVSILTNNGDATFDDPPKAASTSTLGVVDYGVGSGPRSVFTCDLNADGYADLAVANSLSDDVSILVNDGDGTFATAVDYAVGDYPVSIYGADLDDDLDNDLAVANNNSNTVSILENNGDATIEGVVDYGVGTGPRSVFICDLDSDGDNDVVTANSESDDVSVLLNNGDATFATAVSYPAGDSPYSVYGGDIDGDGDNDLVIANNGTDSVSILINNGDATFEGVVDYGVGGGPRSVCLTDVNSDSVYDIVTANSESDDVSVLINFSDEPAIFCELRGDYNRDDQFDILDIDDFIDYLFRDGLPPACEEEVDADDNGQIDILDIDYMVDYLFRDGPEPVPCP